MVRVVQCSATGRRVGNETQEVRVDAVGSERRAEQRNDVSDEAGVRREFLMPGVDDADIRFNDGYVIAG